MAQTPGSTGVFTHRTGGPLSIFGLGEGPGSNCSDLSLNRALKPPVSFKASFRRGERLFGEIFFRKVAGGARERRQVQNITGDMKKNNVNRVTKARPLRNVIVGCLLGTIWVSFNDRGPLCGWYRCFFCYWFDLVNS